MLFIFGVVLAVLVILLYKLVRKRNGTTGTITKSTGRKKITRVLVSLAGLVVLAIIGLLAWWGINLVGPSNSYIQNFDSRETASMAALTKHYLQGQLSQLPLDSQGFKLVSSSYVDGCYPYNDDAYQAWQKVCYGRAVNFYSSSLSASATESKLLSVFSNANWQPTSPRSLSGGCYGYPLDIIGSLNLGFEVNYSVSDLSNGCSATISQINGDSVAIYARSRVHYSNLTQTINQTRFEDNLKSSGHQSYIMISAEKQYFDKKVGFWLIP